jgi:hypothetical protein
MQHFCHASSSTSIELEIHLPANWTDIEGYMLPRVTRLIYRTLVHGTDHALPFETTQPHDHRLSSTYDDSQAQAPHMHGRFRQQQLWSVPIIPQRNWPLYMDDIHPWRMKLSWVIADLNVVMRQSTCDTMQDRISVKCWDMSVIGVSCYMLLQVSATITRRTSKQRCCCCCCHAPALPHSTFRTSLNNSLYRRCIATPAKYARRLLCGDAMS